MSDDPTWPDDLPPDLASQLAVEVMSQPWAHGGTENEHCWRYGDLQERFEKIFALATGARSVNTPKAGEVREDRQSGTCEVRATPVPKEWTLAGSHFGEFIKVPMPADTNMVLVCLDTHGHMPFGIYLPHQVYAERLFKMMTEHGAQSATVMPYRNEHKVEINRADLEQLVFLPSQKGEEDA